jgi:hypothetical protein
VAGPAGGGTTSLEDLARRARSDLDPSLVALPHAPIGSFSSPEWSLDTDALKRISDRDLDEPAAPEKPSSPGTLISDVQRGGKPADRSRASEPSEPAPPANDPLSQLTERIPTIPSPVGSAAATPSPAPRTNRDATGPIPPATPAAARPARDATGPIPPPPAPSFKPARDITGPIAPPPPPSFKPARDITGPITPPPPPSFKPARDITGPIAPPPPPSFKPGRDITGPIAPRPVAAVPASPRPVAPAPDTPGPAAAPAREKAAEVLKREVNRPFVYLVVSGAALLALVIVGVLLQRSCSIAGRASDETAERDTMARKKLLADGLRMLAEGKPREARAAFVELVRQAPNSIAARAALEKADAALAAREERNRRLSEAEARLVAALEAKDAKDWARVVTEADAALALVPDAAEAAALREEALAQIAKQGKEAGRKGAERIRSTKAAAKPTAAPTAVPAPVAAAPKTALQPTPVPTPAHVRLHIAVSVPAPQGYVMLRRNDVEIFRRAFDFGRKSGGGSLDGDIELPSGPAEFKAWVIATDRSVNQYKVVTLTLGADGRTLALDVDASKNLSITLR